MVLLGSVTRPSGIAASHGLSKNTKRLIITFLFFDFYKSALMMAEAVC